jgi:hypothetical protein
MLLFLNTSESGIKRDVISHAENFNSYTVLGRVIISFNNHISVLKS